MGGGLVFHCFEPKSQFIMSTKCKIAFMATVTTVAFTAAQNNSAAQPVVANNAAVPKSPAEQFIQRVKNPEPWFSWGADLRIRNENFDNLLTLNPGNPLHEQDYFRFRTRAWTSLKPVDDLSLNVRITTEPREWMRPAGFTPYKGHSGLDWTEGVIDGLNVQWRNIASLPATLTVGRQDLSLGEGWLVMEGTPNDGSATLYLDAARFTYELPEQHTTIDAIGILQYAKDDTWLPTINNQNRFLTDQNEKGAVLYVANKSLPAANVDGYFIYKHDTRVSSSATKCGDNADIYTAGARVSGVIDEHFKYSAEGAYQFGSKQDLNVKFPAVSTDYRTINAFGFNSKATWLFKDRLNNQVNFSFEFLSGDDPNSKSDEMFDVLWGRWARWSEVGLYSYAAETRVGQEANLCRFGPGWACTPAKGLDFSANYYALFSPEQAPTREASATLFSNDGNFRGHLAQAVLKYKFNPHLAGHIWAECLFPGDYYAHQTTIRFVRAEVSFTF